MLTPLKYHDLELISKKDNIIFVNTISQQYQRIVNRIFHTWLNLKEAQCRQDKRFISIIRASPRQNMSSGFPTK